MIFTYNKEHVGDVLMVIVKDSKGAKLDYERKGNVSRVFLEKNGETVAWNIFVLKATAILGEDYTALVKRSHEERWCDVYPKQGKGSVKLGYN